MRQTLYILTISTLVTSCATIMNQPYKHITIHTTEPSKIIYKQDTINSEDNKAQFSVERRNETLQIIATTGRLTKSIKIEPRSSFMYWSNIFCNYAIGMLVDRRNPKRYTYPQSIYINSTDTISEYYRHKKITHQGELHLHLSLPHINSFHLQPENEGIKINTGFWGLTIGLDYYHSKNQFVSMGASGASDFFVPFPAAVDISGEYELMSSRHVSLSNNHRRSRFTIGYGFSYARNTWDLRYYDRFEPPPPTREPVRKSHNTLGFIFPAYFQVGERSHIGVVYRPTFYNTDENKVFYEHLISVDLAWKIHLTNK